MLLRPLTKALKGDPKDFSWTPEMDSTFTSAQSFLASLPALVHPDPSAKISLAVDARTCMLELFFRYWLVLASFSPCSWVPEQTQFLLISSNWFTVLTLFLSRLHTEVDLILLVQLQFWCCLLLPVKRILCVVLILQHHLLYLEDDAVVVMHTACCAASAP